MRYRVLFDGAPTAGGNPSMTEAELSLWVQSSPLQPWAPDIQAWCSRATPGSGFSIGQHELQCLRDDGTRPQDDPPEGLPVNPNE